MRLAGSVALGGLVLAVGCDKAAPDATRSSPGEPAAFHARRDAGAWFAPGAEACASAAGASAACYFTMGATHYCGGAAPPREVLAQYGQPVCVCNECAVDGDCSDRPGGKCKAFQPQRCEGQPERRCVYPSEPCFALNGCPAGSMCLVREPGPRGRPECSTPPPPRP